MELQADLHNFGKKVEVIERASGTWFQKPRSVYWEWLFFGKDSPLKSIFAEVGENGDQQLSRYLFNLEVESVHEWLGYSKKVEETAVEWPTLEHFYSFGVLLAYAYIFGIKDLHRYNLVMTSTHLQVVDAEVVLTKLVLPHETVLLPFKEVAFELCGLSRLLPSVDAISEEQVSAIVSGYVDVYGLTTRNISKIKTILTESENHHPVRMILRNTVVYRGIANAILGIEDLLPEELIQLQRSDIPYFFKRVGEPELRWVSDFDDFSTRILNLGRFNGDVGRHALKIDKLITEAVSLERQMVQGLFLLMKKIEAGKTRKVKFSLNDLLISPEKIEFCGSQRRFYSVGTV